MHHQSTTLLKIGRLSTALALSVCGNGCSPTVADAPAKAQAPMFSIKASASARRGLSRGAGCRREPAWTGGLVLIGRPCGGWSQSRPSAEGGSRAPWAPIGVAPVLATNAGTEPGGREEAAPAQHGPRRCHDAEPSGGSAIAGGFTTAVLKLDGRRVAARWHVARHADAGIDCRLSNAGRRAGGSRWPLPLHRCRPVGRRPDARHLRR
ncbi:MAG: hypothetical protein KatS3mg060_2578 [Dehalococcoidia bacterium]|nr:MAG: hypothetical protein KatS3mg060_2578 [Dehalococcoidia bacterium]